MSSERILMRIPGKVADIPTRFKYAPVDQSNYHLSATEILMATDAELNEYVGLKKLAPYRKKNGRDDWDSKRTERLKEFKEKVRSRAGLSSWAATSEEQQPRKKRKGKNERERAKRTEAPSVSLDDGNVRTDTPTAHGLDEDVDDKQENGEPHKNKRKRKRQSISAEV